MSSISSRVYQHPVVSIRVVSSQGASGSEYCQWDSVQSTASKRSIYNQYRWEKSQSSVYPVLTRVLLVRSIVGRANLRISLHYLHAQEVYKEFNCQSLLDYMQLYVKTDTILLADLFQNFRKTAFKTYGLDPVHYISLPSYGRDAMLKLTGVEIELISNPEVFNLINRGIRGGMIISF